MASRVILLEFNELVLPLIRRFMEEGHLPNFRRLYDTSDCFRTDAGEEPPYLEPWIQWVTIHTGLRREEHGLHSLDAGHRLRSPRIWDYVSKAGKESWICGSMNVGCDEGFRGSMLPAPRTTMIPPTPEGLRPFFSFVRRNVLGHVNSQSPSGMSESLEFLRFMLRNGLSSSTVSAACRQILREKRTGRYHWRRALILDLLCADLFRSIWRRRLPAFATLFLNSTAHLQHYHWREMEPSAFSLHSDPDRVREYGNAVLLGYRGLDAILGRILAMAGKETTIVLASALGQQPHTGYEHSGGRQTYRVRDFDGFLVLAGLTTCREIAPVMAEEFFLRFDSEEEAGSAEGLLLRLRLADQPLMRLQRAGTELFAGCAMRSAVADDAYIEGHDGPPVKFHDMFRPTPDIASGRHHPEGILWIGRPAGHYVLHDAAVPLEAVAPTLLDLLDIERPKWMMPSLLSSASVASRTPPDDSSP